MYSKSLLTYFADAMETVVTVFGYWIAAIIVGALNLFIAVIVTNSIVQTEDLWVNVVAISAHLLVGTFLAAVCIKLFTEYHQTTLAKILVMPLLIAALLAAPVVYATHFLPLF